MSPFYPKQACEKAGGNWFGNTDSNVTVYADAGAACEGNCVDVSEDPLYLIYLLQQNNYYARLQQLQGSASPGVPGKIRTGNEGLFCLGDALKSNALSLALDAVGLIPEGGVASALFSTFHGAAGISNGTKVLQRVKMGVGIVGTASAANDAQNTGGGLEQAQAVAGIGSIGASLAKAAPVVGQVLSFASLGLDLAKTYSNQSACVASGKYD